MLVHGFSYGIGDGRTPLFCRLVMFRCGLEMKLYTWSSVCFGMGMEGWRF